MKPLSRRSFLNKTMLMSGIAASQIYNPLLAKETTALTVPTWSKSLGSPVNAHPYGLPSGFESSVVKHILMPSAPKDYVSSSIALTSSVSPLSQIRGAITPNGLFFERHHSGVAIIDPSKHKLLIHGLVKNDIILSMDKIKRYPSCEKTYFIECSGNTGIKKVSKPNVSLDDRYGLMSCASWIGVKLSVLLEDAGIDLGKAKYLIAEGADGSTMTRTLPISRAMDDCIIAYAQNGEALRPEQGYPLRLIVPGCEGNINVKWLRRLEVTDIPLFSKDESSKYTDLLSNGKARQSTLVMDVKSVITFPSYGYDLNEKGFYEIRGIAWSGRNKIKHVDVSVDGGKNWIQAKLSTLPLDKAFVEFTYPLHWKGKEMTILSRATDEDAYTQPYFKQITDARGFNSESHNNAIHAWQINTQGKVSNVRV